MTFQKLKAGYLERRPSRPCEPPGPAWLRRLIGDEYFQEVTEVFWPPGAVTAEDMTHVGQLDRLEVLTIRDTSKIGDGLIHIRGLSRLKRVYIFGQAVDDGVLAQISRFPRMEVLWLKDATKSATRGWSI